MLNAVLEVTNAAKCGEKLDVQTVLICPEKLYLAIF